MKYVDKIFCINLDSRTDRWDECIQEFKKIGIEDDVERISAVDIQPGIIGCTKSHYECVKIAKERNYESVLILEDDVTFTLDALDILEKTFEQLHTRDIKFDMLYLGGNPYGIDNQLIDSNLALLVSSKAAHAYIICSHMYDTVLDMYEKCEWKNNNDWHHSNPFRYNIDIFYIRNIQSLRNTYGVYPSIAEQRTSYSDLIHSKCYYNLNNTYNSILKGI